jgi:hypothetical protein
MKEKNTKCPDTKCSYNKKGFGIKVQAEVDVAIAMAPLRYLKKNP